MIKDIPNDLSIDLYFHCGMCLNEYDKLPKPRNISRSDYQQIEAGWTKQGVQIWCKRHDVNIIHIDFRGQKVAVNNTAKGAKPEIN